MEDNTRSTKRCVKCGESKGRDEFFKDNYRSDGLNTMCKQCRLEYNKQWRLSNDYQPGGRKPTGRPVGRPRTGRHFCGECGVELVKNVKRCDSCKEAVSLQRTRARLDRAKVLRRTKYRELKTEMVNRLGGKCSRCGYNEFEAGLCFHHDGDKIDNVGVFITKVSACPSRMEELLDEVGKCVLLCHNCHMSLHGREWEL